MKRALRRLTTVELAALLGLAALSAVSLALVLARAAREGGTWSGADGLLVIDQLQYLNWLRQAAHHVAVANLYDLAPGPRSFVHPGLIVSGLLDLAGVGMRTAYQVWKPVAVLALWAGALVLCRRFLSEPRDRALGLVLAVAVLPLGLLASSPGGHAGALGAAAVGLTASGL